MNLKHLFLALIISQVLYILGAFWNDFQRYYVIEPDKNLCGSFERWSSVEPNWLPEGWRAVYLYDDIFTPFLENINCETWDIANCCKENWYRYAWVPIWQQFISDERAWAEFLASKDIINTRSYNPHEYNLDSYITRKEMMKIVMNVSWEELLSECREIFDDVDNDWGCRYIESALEYWYITWNEAFRPSDIVTQTEALKLIIQATWIGKSYDTWVWQEDYISTAYYLWFIDEKYTYYNEKATRWWIFSAAAKTYSDFSN